MLLKTAAPEPRRETRAFLDREHRLLIGGEWVAAASGKTFEVKNPATGKSLAMVAEGDRPTSIARWRPRARRSRAARGGA